MGLDKRDFCSGGFRRQSDYADVAVTLRQERDGVRSDLADRQTLRQRLLLKFLDRASEFRAQMFQIPLFYKFASIVGVIRRYPDATFGVGQRVAGGVVAR